MQEFTYTTQSREEFRAQIRAITTDDVKNRIKSTNYDHETTTFTVVYEAEDEVTQ